MIDLGLEVIDWLIDIQMDPAGHLSPIGNGGGPGGDKSQFDQQPIEATALLLAARWRARGHHDGRYRRAMERPTVGSSERTIWGSASRYLSMAQVTTVYAIGRQ